MYDEEKVTYFGLTDARNKRVRFGIKTKDRAKHIYAIGKTGMGKSTLLENLAIQDIQNGEGLAFIDPHGKSADLLLEYVPEHRKKDVIYFAPFDLDYPIAFNVLEDMGVEKRHLVANGLMSAFKRIWADSFSARMEYILNNILLALLEFPGSTLMSVNRMLTDKDFRSAVVANVSDPSVKAFWIEEYGKYTEKFAAEAAPAIQNKVGQFVANPLVRNIVGQEKSSFDIRQIMDDRKILIINLSKGRVGEANANLLGAMLITKIYLAAMSRADLAEKDLKLAPQFYLYVDEFQSFANESFADILSEARKYKLNLTIANQYVEQMTEEVRAAVFGNVGTMITFRVGAYDAGVFEKEYAPEFSAEDLVNLQMYQMYLKLMIDGVTSRPFSAVGMPPIARPDISYTDEIIALSREQFANTREKVEENIRNWHIQKIGAKEPVKRVTEKTGERVSERAGERLSERPSRESGRVDQPTMPADNRKEDRNGDTGRGRGREMGGDREGGSRTDLTDRPSRSSVRPESRPDRSDRQDRPERSDRSERRSEAASRARDEDRPRIVGRPPQTESLSNTTSLSMPPAVEDKPIEQPVIKEFADKKANPVSLNSLSSNHPEINKAKNQQKDIKPENVAALREALLSVMGNADAPKEFKIEKTSNTIHVSAQKTDEVEKDNKDPHTGSLTPDDLKRILDINQ
jgi:hypothetical protein